MSPPCLDGAVVTRDEVDAQWSALAAGLRGRGEVSRWAEGRLEAAPDQELVIQGLLYLQALDPALGWRRRTAVTDGAVAAALQRWRKAFADHDRDPDAWDRSYLRGVVRSVAETHGEERARVLGRKLVTSGKLMSEDVDEALG
jgi:hypothetical protein